MTDDAAAAPGLWPAVAPIFAVNDGSLPELSVGGLSGAAVEATFDCLRQLMPAPFPETQYIWLNDAEVPLATLAHPAAEVTSGAGEAFHCTMPGIEVDGVPVPELGVFVLPTEVEIDYRMGPEWDEATVAALLRLLLRCAPADARIMVWNVWEDDVREAAQAAIDAYAERVRSEPCG